MGSQISLPQTVLGQDAMVVFSCQEVRLVPSKVILIAPGFAQLYFEQAFIRYVRIVSDRGTTWDHLFFREFAEANILWRNLAFPFLRSYTFA